MILMALQDNIIWSLENNSGVNNIKIGYQEFIKDNNVVVDIYIWTQYAKTSNTNILMIIGDIGTVEVTNIKIKTDSSISWDVNNIQKIYSLETTEHSYFNFVISFMGIGSRIDLSSKPISINNVKENAITVTDLIDKLNSNFNLLNEKFKVKKVNANSLEDDVINITNNRKIQDGAIDENKLAENSVNRDTLSNNSITSEKIEDGSITLEKFEDKTTNLYKKILYTRGIYTTTNLYDTSFPVGSIVLYYRKSGLNNEDKSWFEGVFG